MAKINLLDALAAVTEDDLTEIDRQIAEAQKKIDGLKVARSVVAVTLHGKTKKVVRAKSPAGGATRSDSDPQALASQIFDLLTAEGPLPVNVIASRLGRAPQAIGVSAARSGWFAKNNEGDYTIARK